MEQDFLDIFGLIISAEGGYDTNREDSGNWTSGKIGEGELKGTKFGIDAASYPKIDIPNLTLDQAREIYNKDYWLPSRSDLWHKGLDYLVFDCAVNQGLGFALKTLQISAGVFPDGVIGPVTINAVASAPLLLLIDEYCARRAVRYAEIGNKNFLLGWFRRLIKAHHQGIVMAVLDGKNPNTKQEES